MCTFACQKWEKIYRTKFYWVVVKVCVGSIQYGSIETLWDRKLVINFFCLFDFLDKNVSKYWKQFWHSSKSL